jgi:uncharacterized protein (TIGR03437 family)
MQPKSVVIAKCSGVALSIIPALIYAYEYGPPPGSAGPPSDLTCGSPACHGSNAGSGGVEITFPNGLQYVPGVKQHILVTITDPVQHRWGFQATVRPSANPRSSEAGDFESTDANTQVVCQDDSQKPASQPCDLSPNFQYVEHTTAGTRLGTPSPVSFEFDWTPDTTTNGDLLFYVAANAANGDGTNFGDHIYYKTVTLKQAASSTPTISQGGVVNGASFGSPIAEGSWVSIMGSGLAADTRSWSLSDFQNGVGPTQLDGTGVLINGKAAFVGYISPTQVNVQAPDDSAAGPIQVQVSLNGQMSPAADAQIQSYSPALFLWQSKYAVAQHADYSLAGPPGLFPNVATTPVLPGETIILYGTGFGPSNPAVPAGVLNPNAVPLANAVTAQVGGIDAAVTFAGLAAGFAGLNQVNITVPDTAPDGDLPVVLTVGGVAAPASLVTVQRGP